MSAVWNTVASWARKAVSTLLNVIKYIGDVAVSTLEDIVGIFGIEDTEIIATEVITMPIIEDKKAYEDTITKVALEHQRRSLKERDVGISGILSVYAERGRQYMTPYYNYGKDYYTYGLPDTSIATVSIDRPAITNAIQTERPNHTVEEVIDARVGQPSVKAIVQSYLIDNYGYDSFTESLVINGVTKSVSPIYVTDLILAEITVKVFIERTLTREYRSKATIVEQVFNSGTDSYDYKIEQMTYYRYLDGSTIVEEEVFSTSYSLEPQSTYPNNSVGDVLSDTLISSNTGLYQVDRENITVPYLVGDHYLEVYYKNYGRLPGHRYYDYFVYDMDSNVYPNLNEDKSMGKIIDMMPVAILRNDGINTVDSTNTALKNTTTKLLKTLNIDINSFTDKINENPDIDNVMDAFVYMAIDPKDANNPAAMKVLYNSIEVIASAPQNTSGDSNIATFREQSVNIALMWDSIYVSYTPYTSGSFIGLDNIGDITLLRSAKNLYLRKRINATTVKSITVNKLRSITFIDRDGLVGTTDADLDNGVLHIPIAKSIIDNLSPLEQTELLPYILQLNFYAAQITTIQWYEQPAFATFLQILTIVVIIVVTIATAGTGTVNITTILTSLVTNLTTGYAVSLALNKLADLIDDPIISGVVRIVSVATAAYVAGKVDISDVMDITTNLVDTIGEYYNEKTLDTLNDINELTEKYQSKLETLEKYWETDSKLTIGEVAELVTIDNFYDIATGSALTINNPYSFMVDIELDYEDFTTPKIY